ncbi:hypothetical protein M3B11_10960 [Brevibacterium sp. p3-SID960]|uniref:hypothetical protein n=1 Tax=Brevibacterium sp. p3-SID960 TaxID=2916063 RepID=UPI0021A8DFA4|nr:hypothetical protein [Brevibacterium sp. p3-SID960]MCT1691461.1 hypothetical protein [Brevibacterium sp. p3-SID960]
MSAHSRTELDATLPSLLFALTASAWLVGRASPDDCAEAFLTSGHPVPLLIADDALDPGAEVPAGMLLTLPRLRAAGIDRVRCVLIHPSLPITVPKVDRAHRRLLAGAQSVAVAEAGGQARAVIVINAEAAMRVVPCAPVRAAGLGAVSAAEASRQLRQATMEALATVESLPEVPAEIGGWQWRDWQAELTGPPTAAEAVAAFVPDPADAQQLITALEIHEAMRSVLVPAAVQPPRLGAALAGVHAAAVDAVTAVTAEPAAPGQGSAP